MTEAYKPNDRNLEQRTRENVLVRPFKRIAYAFRPEKVALTSEQYCHLIDQHTGERRTIDGPARVILRYDERVESGPHDKTVLKDHEYCAVTNPLDPQTKQVRHGEIEIRLGPQTFSLHPEELVGDVQGKYVVPENHFCIVADPLDETTSEIRYGEREVRIGPRTFALHPEERLEQEARKEFVLTQYDGLHIKALTPFERDGVAHKPGDEFVIKGKATYVPTKHEQIVRELRAIVLSDTDGVYVQNKDTGDVSLIRGPKEYFLAPNEQLYKKELTQDELRALGLLAQNPSSGVRVLTRQAANTSFVKDPSTALVLELEDNEVVQLADGADIRIEEGPKKVFVSPYERPKVLTLSGGRPIQGGALKVALLKKGPDFIYDRLNVTTKDNAQLELDVAYKWRFATEDPRTIFSIDDFVGYAAESLSSVLRAEAAAHDFEEFHPSALAYARKAILGQLGKRRFEENGLEIFDVDIKAISAKDPKIQQKLHQAIEGNIDIYCQKIGLKARLDAEREEVEGRKSIEEKRADLISATLKNYERETLDRARVDAQKANLAADAQARNIAIVGDAEREQQIRILQAHLEALTKPGSREYLDLRRVEAFNDVEKLIIAPTDSKIVLPSAAMGHGGSWHDGCEGQSRST